MFSLTKQVIAQSYQSSGTNFLLGGRRSGRFKSLFELESYNFTLIFVDKQFFPDESSRSRFFIISPSIAKSNHPDRSNVTLKDKFLIKKYFNLFFFPFFSLSSIGFHHLSESLLSFNI